MGNKNRKNNKIRNLSKIIFLIISVCLFLVQCTPKSRVYKVGILSGIDAFANIADGFKYKMIDLGYIEGKNIEFDFQKVNVDPVKTENILKKFVTDKVDLIFTFPTEPAIAAKKAVKGTSIPVVFALASIEENDLIQSISNPGDNITGVRFTGPDQGVKKLEILHELVPYLKRILIIYDPYYPTYKPSVKSLNFAASSRGISLLQYPVHTIEEIKTVLQTLDSVTPFNIDAIMILPEMLTQSPEAWSMISKFAEKHNLPVAGSAAFELKSGALFTYSADTFEAGQLAAIAADKILKGTPAGTIFVVTPKVHLRLNYKQAQKLGLKVSEGIMGMASEIIR